MPTSNSNQRSWLVMLYIAVDDVKSNLTDPESLYDECDKMLGDLGRMDNDNIYLVALFDSKCNLGSTIRSNKNSNGDYLHDITEQVIKKGGMLASRFGGTKGQRTIDTGSRETLGAFIGWALEEYQATYTILAIIGHGCGWTAGLNDPATEKSGGSPGASPDRMGLCPDLTAMNAISTVDLGEALENGLPRENDIRRKINVLFLDACLMGMIEVMYEINDYVEYIITGQDFLYARLPYTAYLAGLGSSTSPEQLARNIVEEYNKEDLQNAWTITAVNTAGLKELKSAINGLASGLQSILKLTKDQEDDNHELAEESLYILPDSLPWKISIKRRLKAAYAMTQKFNFDTKGVIEEFQESYVDLFDLAFNLGEQLYVAIKQIPQRRNTQKLRDNLESAMIMAFRIAWLIGEDNRDFRIVPRGKKQSLSEGQATPSKKRLDSEIVPQKSKDPSPEVNIVLKNKTRSISGKEGFSLDRAYGISIYLPLGKDNVLLERYTDQSILKFMNDCPEWGNLLELLCNKRPQPEQKPEQRSRLGVLFHKPLA